MKMKCLMLKQPWAWLVATGRKPIETRTWKTMYRGPLAIGASQLYDVAGASDLLSRSIHFPEASQLVRGAVLATVNLSLIEPYRKSHEALGLVPFTEGEKRFAWFLDDVKMLETPLPITGRLGLFDVDLDALARPVPMEETRK